MPAEARGGGADRWLAAMARRLGIYLAFRAIGWTWGGDWRSLKDYMHFSANGL